MIEDHAVKILVESIKQECESTIEDIARRLVKKFNEGPKPDEGQMLNLKLELNISTDLLYEIEEYLAAKQNGKKKFRRNFYRKRQ